MKVIVQNLAIEYRSEGSGKVLLFLHGWQDSLQSFDSLVPFLASAYRVIRLDLPGFGKSEVPREIWDLDKYINFVNAFIQKLDIEVYAIVGHSFGGRIIIKGAGRKVFKTQKIILIGSAGIAKRKTFRNYFFKIVAKTGKFVTSIPPLIFYREKLRNKMYRWVGGDYLQAGALRGTFLKVLEEDLSENAKNIKIPSLLIWGANDTETPAADGKRLSLLILGSKLEILQNSGHFVHKEKPKEVAELIEKFL